MMYMLTVENIIIGKKAGYGSENKQMNKGGGDEKLKS